jgi:hypothetical protein
MILRAHGRIFFKRKLQHTVEIKFKVSLIPAKLSPRKNWTVTKYENSRGIRRLTIICCTVSPSSDVVTSTGWLGSPRPTLLTATMRNSYTVCGWSPRTVYSASRPMSPISRNSASPGAASGDDLSAYWTTNDSPASDSNDDATSSPLSAEDGGEAGCCPCLGLDQTSLTLFAVTSEAVTSVGGDGSTAYNELKVEKRCAIHGKIKFHEQSPCHRHADNETDTSQQKRATYTEFSKELI